MLGNKFELISKICAGMAVDDAVKTMFVLFKHSAF